MCVLARISTKVFTESSARAMELPIDVVLAIVRLLPAKSVVALASTCSRLAMLSTHEWLWEEIMVKELPNTCIAPSLANYKRLMRFEYTNSIAVTGCTGIVNWIQRTRAKLQEGETEYVHDFECRLYSDEELVPGELRVMLVSSASLMAVDDTHLFEIVLCDKVDGNHNYDAIMQYRDRVYDISISCGPVEYIGRMNDMCHMLIELN
jgi:hypothetical protein